MTKVCSKCGLEKVGSEFYNNPTAPDGKQSRCKECTKATSRARNDAVKAAIASSLLLISGAYAGTPTPSPTATPIPIATPAVPLEISLAAITAGNQVVIDGFIKGSPYYFHITFDVFETAGPYGRIIPATMPTPDPTPSPTATPK
jgi:hypothetical protein